MPPAMKGGKPAADVEVKEREAVAEDAETASEAPAPTEISQVRAVAQSLVVNEPVRSGQSIIFPEGDVTIVGSVASGAEVIAGGSIHIYGALRGRAMAGSIGNSASRIFCRKLEAELVAIDGIYKMIEDMSPALLGQPVQLWLDGDSIMASTII
jgi:septum site-determining protein MinC